MPYASDRQRKFFHTENARRAGITPAMVREYDDASRAEKNGAAYGVPKAPSLPKPPGTSATTLGPRAPGSYRGVPPIAKAPAVHKPLASLQTQTTQRSSDVASQSAGSKLGGPAAPQGG